MKDQMRLQIRGRKNATSTPSSELLKNKKIPDATTAFRPYKEEHFEPTKVQKPVRKSGRIATNTMRQSLLNLKPANKEETDVNPPKRKADSLPKETKKKHKIIHSSDHNTIEENHLQTKQNSTDTPIEEIIVKPVAVNKNVKSKNTLVKVVERQAKVVERPVEVIEKKAEVIEKKVKVVEKKVEVVEKKLEVEIKEKRAEITTKEIVLEKRKANNTIEQKELVIKSINNAAADDLFFASDKSNDEATYDTPPVDSPSPPSGLTEEPYTPPVYAESSSAPYKTYLTEADKLRIEEEKLTLTKVRKALDIVITDRMARSKPTLYHQIEPVLRNSTRKSVTIAHVCKVMYVAPNLYTIEAKELRDFGGKVTEAFSIQFDNQWQVPLVGKDFQQRSDLLKTGLDNYFNTHKEPDATVPEIKLPRLSLVVDKKDWINQAHLPAGIKALLETHKKISEAEEESKKPKPKPVGTVKDRMAALRARLAKKNSS
ncbi:hypothetical protein MFLAVUS_007995 [Mucor flavus]|uniref:CDT1 Geminin-binding domain-containing protein n=1 Tax=Mucor flavus TaxID=439312 RepID=A0ABP9Z5U4_9FUNG